MKKPDQLQYALQRLLNCFYSRERWPKISMAVDKKLWFHGGRVDDTTREAIRYAERILKGDVK